MTNETFNVNSLSDERDAYEAEQYLAGLRFIDEVSVDFIEGTVELSCTGEVSRERILDEIERSGANPAERDNSIINGITNKLFS